MRNEVIETNAPASLRDFTVEEHLAPLGGAPEWVVALGSAIQEITACDPAIAASRARDLSINQSVAQGVEHSVNS
jgi:hypothetical protein